MCCPILIRALQTWPNLQSSNLHVCFADNNIGCRGADAMASVLQSANLSLTTLDLTGACVAHLMPHLRDLTKSFPL